MLTPQQALAMELIRKEPPCTTVMLSGERRCGKSWLRDFAQAERQDVRILEFNPGPRAHVPTAPFVELVLFGDRIVRREHAHGIRPREEEHRLPLSHAHSRLAALMNQLEKP